MAEPQNELEIRLHSYDAEGGCLADIVLPDSGIRVQDLKVKKGLGSGIEVHMPNWMHTRWGYREISWAEVRQQVSECYRATQVPESDEAFRADFMRFDVNADRLVPEDLKTPLFRFYSGTERMECSADVTVIDEAVTIRDLFVTYEGGTAIWVHMPQYMRGVWAYDRIDWTQLREGIASRFRAQVLDQEEPENGTLTVQFREIRNVKRCLADAAVPGKRSVLKGFRLKDLGNGLIRVSPPVWMSGLWKDRNLTWVQLTELIRAAYTNQTQPEPHTVRQDQIQEPVKEKTPVPENEPIREQHSLQETVQEQPQANTKSTGGKRVKNELGRVANARSSDFWFVSQTVLRPEETDEEPDNRRSTSALVEALTKGPKGGIGPMEIKIVSWVEQMRYLTTAMLTDLFEGGYISRGWRQRVTKDKISNMLNRLRSFGLVTLSRFVTVDEEGNVLSDRRSDTRILTLDRTGSRMLHDMGIGSTGYRPFDIFQDGNTIKRYLAANQWLIYWMVNFPEEVGDEYETARVVYQRGLDMQGVRMYATVTCNGHTMVAEPVRRVEEFEQRSNRVWLRDKLRRFLEMFNHMDELYSSREELVFPERPVLIYVCEDDDHIQQVRELIGDMLEENPCQEVWFTTDLRIFNYDMMGQRFLKISEDQLTTVDLTERIGIVEKTRKTE